MTEIVAPFQQFFDTSGRPLANGAIYIGTANLDAQTNPIAVYWDEALTIPAPQPIRTLNGYPVWNGAPARLYANVADYSITVRNAQNRLIYSAADVTSALLFSDPNGSSLVGFINNGTGAVARTAQDKMRDFVHIKDFGAVGDGVVDDGPAIQRAIDYVLSQGISGSVYLGAGALKVTSTINVVASGPGVLLVGNSADGIHDGAGSPGATTTVRWAGAVGGTVFNFASAIGGAHMYGGGLENVKIKCENAAGIGVLINSVSKGTFKDVFVESPRIAAFKTTTLGNALLTEASDTQRCVFDRCSWRCIDFPETRAAHGFWITSHAPLGPSTANTSLNYFSQLDGQNWGGAGGGVGLFIEDGDNNMFVNPRLTRAGGTTVECVRLVGTQNCDANQFWNLSAGGANGIAIKGIASGFVANPKLNSFWVVDVSNGTQYPTADAGVRFQWNGDNGIFVKSGFLQLAISDNALSAISGVEALSDESLRVINGSENHVRLTDGTNTWAVGVTGAGDLRIFRVAGTGAGKLNLGNGGPVMIDGKDVTVGAVDSGGTGFRVLRVPN